MKNKIGNDLKRQVVELYMDPTRRGSFGPLKEFVKALGEKKDDSLSLLTARQIRAILQEFIFGLSTRADQRWRFERRSYDVPYLDYLWLH